MVRPGSLLKFRRQALCLVLLVYVALAAGARAAPAGEVFIAAEPLPEQFTATARFTLDPRGAEFRVITVGLSASPDGPPTLLALSLDVRRGGFFGPFGDLKLTSSNGLLEPVSTGARGSADFAVRSTILLSPDDTYEASLSVDRRTGLVSIRFASHGGNVVLAEGHVHIKPVPGEVYAGFGTPEESAAGADAPLRLVGWSVIPGHERMGKPMELERSRLLFRVTHPDGEKDLLAGAEPVYPDRPLIAEIAGPSQLPGEYRILLAGGGGVRSGEGPGPFHEVWRGTIPEGADRIRFPLPGLPAGRHEMILQYVEPGYELELARGAINLVAATVEGFIRHKTEGQRSGGPEPAGEIAREGEIVLVADRDVRGLHIWVTAADALLWEGSVDLEAGEPQAIPVAWEISEPFEYAFAYDYPAEINSVQLGRRIPMDHPFLLVRPEDYPELRARSLRRPWSEMRQEAQRIVAASLYPNAAAVQEKALALKELLSAGALMYILDPANRPAYHEKLKDAFARLDDLYTARLASSGWDANVPVGDAVFTAILALDVVYYDLDSRERRAVEARIDRLVQAIDPQGWTLSPYAVRGTWALFRGDRESLERYKRLYREELFNEHILAGGVYSSAPGYALARFAGADREQKHLFMDVLEFTGEDTYYSEPKLQAFYEWLYAHSVAPDGIPYSFGDTSPNRPLDRRAAGTAFYRAYRFSEAAGDYAAWWSRNMRPPGSLTAYVLLDRVPTPRQPQESRIYPDGGAWFVDAGPGGSRWLAGALWNPTSNTGHAHKDVNAIHRAGYGRQLVVNSRYRGWGNGAYGFSWEYLHDTAESSNTVVIDGVDHQLKRGAGIEAGFVTGRFAYAVGNSGRALPNGVHIRNLMFVPSSEIGGGYWILLDRVEAAREGATVGIALHPRSARVSTIAPGREYAWEIVDVTLTVFLATPPSRTEIKEGLLAGFDESIVGRYLLAEYPAPAPQARSIVTVIFPQARDMSQPVIERVQGEGYSGARVSQGERLVDTVLESAGADLVNAGEVAFQAVTSVYRRVDGETAFYFVEKGSAFRLAGSGEGFVSSADVSIYLEGNLGKIDSPGTIVRFYKPGIVAVKLDGETASTRDAHADLQPGWIEVYVPEGVHSIELVVSTDSDGKGG